MAQKMTIAALLLPLAESQVPGADSEISGVFGRGPGALDGAYGPTSAEPNDALSSARMRNGSDLASAGRPWPAADRELGANWCSDQDCTDWGNADEASSEPYADSRFFVSVIIAGDGAKES